MFSKKRAARVVPFVVLFGALGVGALAWTGALPAEAFNYAVAGSACSSCRGGSPATSESTRST